MLIVGGWESGKRMSAFQAVGVFSTPVYAAIDVGRPRYSSPVDSTAQAIHASLLAAATISRLRGALASSAVTHGRIASRTRLHTETTARAPWIRILCKKRLPRLLLPDSLALPPVEHRFGTKSIQAANPHPLRGEDSS